jgi:hypothetical protein
MFAFGPASMPSSVAEAMSLSWLSGSFQYSNLPLSSRRSLGPSEPCSTTSWNLYSDGLDAGMRQMATEYFQMYEDTKVELILLYQAVP